MSDQANRLFLYTDRISGRILYLKKSRDLDFTISGNAWICHEITTPHPLPADVTGRFAWDPVHGLKPVAAPGTDELTRHRLLQKKLEILIAMRANLHVIWIQAKPSFSNKTLLGAPVQRKNFFKLWRLVTFEKKQLKTRISDFFKAVQSKVEGAPTLEILESEYKHIVNNVTLGGYAASSRDIGESHGKGS